MADGDSPGMSLPQGPESSLAFELDMRATLLTLNLVPFLASVHPWIGMTVFVNGAACHNARAYGSPLLYGRLRNWDVTCNVALACWVNVFAQLQPLTLALSCFAACAWVLNNYIMRQSAVIHATMVQWPLCVAFLCY